MSIDKRQKPLYAASLQESGQESASPTQATQGATRQTEGATDKGVEARPVSPLHVSALHESGYLHASGHAIYVDDIPAPQGMRIGMVIPSPIARGRLVKYDLAAARAIQGVDFVFGAADIPGLNDIAPFTHDEPLLAKDEVFTIGQSVFFVVADSYETCRAAAAAVETHWQWEESTPILTIQEAIAADSFLTIPHVMQRGDADKAIAEAAVRISGDIETGGQDHFYLESHASLALPEEDGTYRIYASTQHPSEVQAKVAEVLGIGSYRVIVEAKRMGGGFGGKETQGAIFAALAALGARKTGHPVKVWLNRDQDMMQTGKRHPFYSRYEAGFDEQGQLLGVRIEGFSNGGWSCDLSGPILDRYMFHVDNAYYLPTLHVTGRVVKTNVTSNTAFRGFGGPQGMVVIEEILNRAADRLGLDPAEIRRRNFYGPAPRNLTQYWQDVPEDRSARIYEELTTSADYASRRAACDAFNAKNKWIKRGIGYQPVKFGISFTNSMLNQAGALVLIYADGTVQLNHGGTEMGQGLHTKMLAVCAHELGVKREDIRVMTTATDKVPNTSATAASSGSDINGMAVQQACQTLRKRLAPVAAELLDIPPTQADTLIFANNEVYHPTAPDKTIAFSAVTMQAYVQQISLSSTGFYRTPDIVYDASKGRGKPFHYFAYGAAILEAEVNGLTGEHRLLRVDILHDVGNSLVPSIDIGQIEGAFIQGLGWLTCEELIWDNKGYLRTHSPDTYKIPAVGEAPLDFRVALLDRAAQRDTIHGSKAVGEPPFMLAIGVLTALRQAISSFAAPNKEVHLTIPATPEAVLRAIEAVGEL